MFGWYNNYVRKTRGRIGTVRLDGRTKVLVPLESSVPCEPFLPFIGGEEPAKPLKSRYKRKVFHCEAGGEGFYLKKYSYRFTRKHYASLRGFIWTIPLAQRQLHKMLFLRECGAGVAEPVMAFVRRYGMLKQESLLVMRECHGILLKRFLNEVDNFERRLAVLAQTFRFLQISHANRIHHGDMARHNFIVTPRDELRAFDLDERKTKWLGPLGNRRELKKWVSKSARMLGVEGENEDSPGRRAFEAMLGANYPEARELYRKMNVG